MSVLPPSHWGNILHDYIQNYGKVDPKTTIGFIKLILTKGFNIDYQYPSGKTLLHIATIYKDDVLINILVKLNANLNIKDNLGLTPIQHAFKNRHFETFSCLFMHGANIPQIWQKKLDSLLSTQNNIEYTQATKSRFSLSPTLIIPFIRSLNLDINSTDRNGYTIMCNQILIRS